MKTITICLSDASLEPEDKEADVDCPATREWRAQVGDSAERTRVASPAFNASNSRLLSSLFAVFTVSCFHRLLFAVFALSPRT